MRLAGPINAVGGRRSGADMLDLTRMIAQHGYLDFVARHHTAANFLLLTTCTSSADPTGVADDSGDDYGDGLPQLADRLPVYPNPFNPRAAIRFYLAKSAQVELAVYDLRGRRVALLIQGHLPAGPHETDLAAENLAPGTNVARLRAGDAILTTKLMLVR
jgi:hypothetical protein